MPKTLPPQPDIDWLKKTAKQRLSALRTTDASAKLHRAQFEIAKAYGFGSWRALKAHIASLSSSRSERRRVFEAARAGDAEAVRRALQTGFDPATTDSYGQTIYQIAKAKGHEAVELLVRDFMEYEFRPLEAVRTIDAMLDAAASGEADILRRLLDDHPRLIDAVGGGFRKETALHRAAARSQHACMRLLLRRGADVHARDFPDNASPLHVAAASADVDAVKILVEAGSDVIGEGDDYGVGVLGWSTCFGQVREDIAAYLLSRGAKLNLWTAIALDRSDEVRKIAARDPSVLHARMTRNQHRRTALHHAAAKNRQSIVALLLELGADPNATDAAGATPLTTASQDKADPAIVATLLEAGAKLDFLSAINLKRYDLAETMLRDDPSRIGPDGRDTIALHLAVSKRNLDSIRWLIEHGVDINAKRTMWDCNHTALHMTVENGAVNIAKMLLDAGADPNIRDDKYVATMLGWAEFFSRNDFVQLARDRGGLR